MSQAIWYTETAGIEGPAFGNVNTWKGLGIFCDSFDNDQQVGLNSVNFGICHNLTAHYFVVAGLQGEANFAQSHVQLQIIEMW